MSHIKSLVGFFGRACLAAIFIISGVGKIIMWDQLIVQMTANGLTTATAFLLFLAATVEIVAGFSLFVGWHYRLAAVLLALYLIPVTFFFHNFWQITDQAMHIAQFAHFLKNLAIFGGLLCIAAAPSDKTD